jgi:hypothetical protein
MRAMRKILFLGLALGLALSEMPAHAMITTLPPSLAQDVLSETVPTAFAPFDLSTEDYVLEWVGAPIAGVELKLAPESLQWVRVMEVLSLPRARLRLTAKQVQGGRVTNAGFHQAMTLYNSPTSGSFYRVELPVALISGEQNLIEVRVLRNGQEVAGRAALKFHPRPELSEERVLTDASCSRFGMKVTGVAQSKGAHGWAYVGCRVAEVQNTEHRTSSLETYVFWDNVGQSVRVGGVETPATSVSVWPLRLRTAPGEVVLQSPTGEDMKIRYSTPDNFHRAFLGLGIGPYTDHFEGVGGDDLSTVAPVLTIYGSYFVTEVMRVVAFGATTVDPHLTTDFGLYLNSEYIRVLDRRVVANLMLGAHVIGFRTQNSYSMFLGLPQGMEVSFVDAFKKGHNLTTGVFLFPAIDGKSYYNVWLRWGSGKLFGEFNYIAWSEKTNDQLVSARSAGFSIGIPIARFF